MATQYQSLTERCIESVTAEGYTVQLAVADLPVKPSRRAMRRVSVVLLRDGRAVPEADVAVDFHPLHARRQTGVETCASLLLTPPYHLYVCIGQFDGSIALREGEYRVDVHVNDDAHAAFVLQM